MADKIFNIKVEDMPLVGDYVFKQYECNEADFTAFSLIFNKDFKDKFRKLVDDCAELNSPHTITAAIRGFNDQIEEFYPKLRTYLNRAEFYVKQSKLPLTVGGSDSFKISNLRYLINNRISDDVIVIGKQFIANVEMNKSALAAVGMPDTFGDELKGMLDGIWNIKQNINQKLLEKQMLTDSNMDKFNSLWLTIRTVLDAAKAIYRNEKNTAYQRFTMAEIRRVLRLDMRSRSKKDDESNPDNSNLGTEAGLS